VVLEIGAGDLRLARRLALVARQVIAWERQTAVLPRTLFPPAPNLIVRVVDALE
jgi:16S rRNA A1518/A1519 N6-dimethyltransferase RsmA/KsgA/DIM1 with predicted DNA glycosylase/AP lyase activity